MVEIVPLGPNDIPFAKSLTDAEGWARSEREWRRFLRVQPDGFFRAVCGGMPVGIVGMFCYEQVAWIHSLIIVPGQRRRGIGRQLVAFCSQEANRRGIRALKLDAAPGTVPFYEKLGWRPEFPSRRFTGKGRPVSHGGRVVRDDEVDALVEMDREALGWDRSRLIRELLRDEPDDAFVFGPSRHLEGYVGSAPAEGRVEIGPMVVPSGEVRVARELMRAVLNRWPGQPIRCCVPGNHSEAARLMAEFGFAEVPPSTRMAFGETFREGATQFLMAGPAEG